MSPSPNPTEPAPRPQTGVGGCLLTLAFSMALEVILLAHRVPVRVEDVILWMSIAAGVLVYAAVRMVPHAGSGTFRIVSTFGLNIGVVLGILAAVYATHDYPSWHSWALPVAIGVGFAAALFSTFISRATLDLLAAVFPRRSEPRLNPGR